MNYLKLISSLAILLILINCSDRNEEDTLVSGTFIYINETNEPVYIAGNCNFSENNYEGILIPSGDTDTLYIVNALRDGGGISMNDEYVFYGSGSCMAIYGDSVSCSFYPFRLIKNYEIEKKSPKTIWN